MRQTILATALVLLAVVVGLVYWRMYFTSTEKVRRPLGELHHDTLAAPTASARVAAANGLTEYAGDSEWNLQAVAALRDVVQQSHDADVKAAVMDGLRRANDWDSLPVILVLMNDESEWLRARAGVAAEELVGAKYGFVASDPEPQRQEIIAAIKDYYEKMNAAREQAKRKGEP